MNYLLILAASIAFIVASSHSEARQKPPKGNMSLTLTRKLIDLSPGTPASIEKLLRVKLRLDAGKSDATWDVYHAKFEKGPWKVGEFTFSKSGHEALFRLEYTDKTLTEKEITAAFGNLPRLPGNHITRGSEPEDFIGYRVSGKSVTWILGPGGFAKILGIQ